MSIALITSDHALKQQVSCMLYQDDAQAKSKRGEFEWKELSTPEKSWNEDLLGPCETFLITFQISDFLANVGRKPINKKHMFFRKRNKGILTTKVEQKTPRWKNGMVMVSSKTILSWGRAPGVSATISWELRVVC